MKNEQILKTGIRVAHESRRGIAKTDDHMRARNWGLINPHENSTDSKSYKFNENESQTKL